MIIGIAGYARSGKDAAAKILVEHYGYERRAFADILRSALLTLNPVVKGTLRLQDLVEENGWEVAKGVPEVRRLIQVFGTDVGRHYFGDNIWVDMAFKDLTPESNVVIADVRFPSEAQRVADYDGANWRIERPGVGPVNNHKSESALVAWEFDKYIKNDFNLEKLEADLHELMSFYDIPRITTPVSA